MGSKLFNSFIAETHTVVNAKEKAMMEAEKSKPLKSSHFRKGKQKTKQQQNKLYHILGVMRGEGAYRGKIIEIIRYGKFFRYTG